MKKCCGYEDLFQTYYSIHTVSTQRGDEREEKVIQQRMARQSKTEPHTLN